MPRSSHGTVLIVEDEENLRINLTLRFEGEGFEVLESGDAKKALDLVANRAIDVILLDYMLPDMKGDEVLRTIREKHSSADLPVIMLTAIQDLDAIVQLLDAGANDYVTKPFEMRVLVARIGAQMALRDAVRLKNDVLRIVSHEMKNPLTNAIGSLSFIKATMMGEMSGDASEMIEIAYQGNLRLERLVNNILNWEQIKAGKAELHLKRLALGDAVRTAVSETSMYAKKYDVSVVNQVPEAAVRADSDALHQILTNLIGNAVKFTKKGGVVTVTGAFAVPESTREKKEAAITAVRSGHLSNDRVATNGEIIVAVVDEGRGIPMKMQSRIFESYQQVEESDKSVKGGTGLGLAISSALARQMGGDIWFGSEPGIGTTFFFPLKLDNPMAKA